MLNVELNNILTEDETTASITDVLRRADEEGTLFVVTRAGKPAVAILDLEQLEALSGKSAHAEGKPLKESATETAEATPIAEAVPAQPEPVTAPDTSGLPDMPA